MVLTPLQTAYLMADGFTPNNLEGMTEEEISTAIAIAKTQYDLESMPGVIELSNLQEIQLRHFMAECNGETEDSLEAEMGTFADPFAGNEPADKPF